MANGRLVRVRRGVFALGHRPAGDRARWTAAVLERAPRAWLADLSGAALRRVVERADLLELFDLNAVAPILDLRRGPGAVALRDLLADAAEHGLPQARSQLEADFLEFCRAYRLSRPQVNRWDGTFEVDFRWPDRGLIVETDGWGVHRTRAAFERDALRTQALTAQGWTVIRITWRQLIDDPEGVAERLRRILR